MFSSSLTAVPSVLFAGRYRGDVPVPFHEHARAELVLRTAGACTVRINDTHLEGQAGTQFELRAWRSKAEQAL